MSSKTDTNRIPANSNIYDYICKIDKVSDDEFNNMIQPIYEVLESQGNKNIDKLGKDSYLDLLVDYHLQSDSKRVFKILVGLSSPLDEQLFNILINKLSGSNKSLITRHSVLLLISDIVHQTPTWLSQIINLSILNNFFQILRNDEEVVILGTSALILVELIATLPTIISHCLLDIFNCFSRLSTFLYRKKLLDDCKDDTLFLHLNSIVYRLFFRLYAMYPCNFINFLKKNYGMQSTKENGQVFVHILEPMLSRIRFHPLLITASKDKECDKARWFYKEAHDILDECGQFAIDPIESYPEICSDFGNPELTDSSSGGDEHEDGDEDDDIDSLEGVNETLQYDDCTLTTDLPYESTNENIDSTSIFHQMNEKITLNKVEDISLLGSSSSFVKSSKSSKKSTEFAEEAIMLSDADQSDLTGNDNFHSSKFSPISKSVIVPMAIPALSKTNVPLANSMVTYRKNASKTVCFSPFKPIKETIDIHTSTQNHHNKSPLLLNVLSTSTPSNSNHNNHHESFNLNNDNDDVDMEIVRFNYKSSEEFCKSTNIDFSPLSHTNFEQDEIVGEKSPSPPSPLQGKETSFVSKCSDQQLAAELVGNIKNSLKKANSRIRYQSNCLPESNKDPEYYYCLGGEGGDSPSGSLYNLRFLSKSCPMLYFKYEDEYNSHVDNEPNVHIDNEINNKTMTQDDVDVNRYIERRKTATIDCVGTNTESDVNLILKNPELESTRINLKKTCKSVDFTKEARRRHHSHHHHNQQHNHHNNHHHHHHGHHSHHDSKRRTIFDSNLSMNINHSNQRSDGMQQQQQQQFTPHQLLDRILFLKSETYHMELMDRCLLVSSNSQADHYDDQSVAYDAGESSRRNSIMNTNSSASSIEHLPSSSIMLNGVGGSTISENDMKKQLAIMYAQLRFERHQRDSHVIRNRRLYKRAKECIQLQEKNKALKEQLQIQKTEIEQLEMKLKDKIFDFGQQRKLMNDKMAKLENELESCNIRCQQLQIEKNNQERLYKDEIKSLNENYRTSENELNRYICTYKNKQSDLNRLEAENAKLKNRLFLFGESYTKIKDLYLKSKMVADHNQTEQLNIRSLKYDFDELYKQYNILLNELDIYKDKCSRLEEQLKQEQAMAKAMNTKQDLIFYQDQDKMKTKQIESLKTIIVNLNKHITILNGQIQSQQQQTQLSSSPMIQSTNDGTIEQQTQSSATNELSNEN